MFDGFGEFLGDFDIVKFFGFFWEGFLWVLGKVWEGFNLVYSYLVDAVGEFGALVLIFSVVFFVFVLVVYRSIASTQGGIERFSHSFGGWSLRLFFIFVVMVIIIYILSDTG